MRLVLPFVAFVIAGATTAAETTTRLDRLETGTQRAEAIRAIKRLQNAYSHYLEAGAWDDLASLFAANAVGRFGATTLNGRAAIRDYWMQQAGRTEPGLAEGQLNTHLLLQPIVNLGPDGLTGKGTWHEVAMVGRFNANAAWYGGIYENEYAFVEGAWKITKLDFHEQYRGAYEDAGQKAPPQWNIPYHFEAAHVGLTIPPSAWESHPAAKPVSDATRLAAVAQRIERMNDETAVQNLQNIYGYYVDRKLWDDAADLFAAIGTFEQGNHGVYAGPARIRKAFEALYQGPGLRYGELWDHLQLSNIVTVAPDGATARARVTELAQLGLNNEYARWELGTYENHFVKQSGVWKLQAVHYYPRLITNYDKGWAREALAAPGPLGSLPPDRPSTTAHTTFPKFAPAPFHYGNPTGKPAALRNAAPIQPADLPARLDAAEVALASAIGVDATENLQSAYGYYLDESAWDSVAEMWSKDGVFELSSVGIYIGRDRVRQSLKLRYPNNGRGPNFYTIHQLTQPVIHVSADGKSARARMRLFQMGGSANGSSGSWIGGTYENAAVFEDGEWKASVKDLQHSFQAAYRTGWAKYPPRPTGTPTDAAASRSRGASAVTNRIQPDRPERSRQYLFPEIDEPAFHYKNPISGRTPQVYLP